MDEHNSTKEPMFFKNGSLSREAQQKAHSKNQDVMHNFDLNEIPPFNDDEQSLLERVHKKTQVKGQDIMHYTNMDASPFLCNDEQPTNSSSSTQILHKPNELVGEPMIVDEPLFFVNALYGASNPSNDPSTASNSFHAPGSSTTGHIFNHSFNALGPFHSPYASQSFPTTAMATTRQILPLVSLNPYQGSWTIKVRVTNKGSLRPYKNARGEGYVFNVELTDGDGTQIQATMFNEVAEKLHPIFELGTVYYISKGTVKVANQNFNTVRNTYEMTINRYSIVEKATDEDSFIPEITYNFVKIGQLESYVNGKEIVDVIGVVQKVSSNLSVRRKSDNEILTKRDITIVDDSNKTVIASLWNELATKVGCKLLDMVDTSPIVAIKYVKVGDFQGLSLSTLSKSSISINPDIPEAKNLITWYNCKGKDLKRTLTNSDRVVLSHITNNSSLNLDKPVFFNVNVYITYIKSQSIWYRACKSCNKKVVEAARLDYWCEACMKNQSTYSLRYIMTMKVSDSSGEAWCTAFNEEVEQIIGCTADELNKIKNEEGEEQYQLKLKELLWVPRLFKVLQGI